MNNAAFLRLRMLAIIMIFAFVSGCATTSVRQHPDFVNASRAVKTIAVLPPDVEFVRITFNGDNERDSKAEAEIKDRLSSDLKTLLEQRGYTANTSLTERLNGTDKQLGFEYENLKMAYAQASKELYEKNKVPVNESTNFNVSVGPVANTFSAAGSADALVYVRYRGFDKSGGQMAKEIVGAALLAVLTGVAPISSATGGRIELAVIDGTSGQVLWTNTFSGPNQGSGTILRNVLAKLPAAGTSKADTAKVSPETATPKKETEQKSPAAEPSR